MKYDAISTRMKAYESVPNIRLTRRTPVIIRLDGKSFHTWTKGCDRPFDNELHYLMMETSKALCFGIQNAQFAYTQSDEISILLTDYAKLETDQWFDGKIQKIVSISAAMATAVFNMTILNDEELKVKFAFKPAALFDARVFNIPKEEVNNYFIWRQQDATRNSIQMLGQANFSHKELQKKSTSNIQDMLMEKDNINWNDLDIWKKRGSCIVRTPPHMSYTWDEDKEIPIFTKDRDFIEKLL